MRTTPPSYRVADLGAAGVPRLNATEAAMLRKIRRFVHSATLRFAHVAGG